VNSDNAVNPAPALLRATLPSSVRLEDERGLPSLRVSTPQAAARVFLHGAHVAAWQPSHAPAPVIWLSGRSLVRAGKPIRGGVPICFPWFGPHPSDTGAPAHGFARLADWTLTDAGESADGVVMLTFVLPQPAGGSLPPFELRHRISIGRELAMTLETRNTGTGEFDFEEALHTYFAVSDIRKVAVSGLERTDYLDKVAGFARRTQGDEPIRFTAETDRVYLNTTAQVAIDDPGNRRRIVASKEGSRSTVVWNPWIDKARAMPDFGDDEWIEMVCVETANVGDARVRLGPNDVHTMTAMIGVEAA
jgi:glucose-6-phosphate 1-epimerase